MTMTDPIADFLTRLRNANSAYHDEVALPHSKIKANIAEILKSEGYISDFHVEDARVGKKLVVQLKYGPSRERSIAGLRRVSKPGLRVYAKSTNLPRVLGGLGVAIISTSSGLRTDRQAAREGVGGEVLAYVWRGVSRHVANWKAAGPGSIRGRRDDRRPERVGQGTEGFAVAGSGGTDFGVAQRRRRHRGGSARRRAAQPFAARVVAHAG